MTPSETSPEQRQNAFRLFGLSPLATVALLIIVTIDICVSCAGFLLVRGEQERTMRTEFELASKNRIAALEREIEANLKMIVLLRAHFESSPGVNRIQFGEFVQPALDRIKTIHALEWILRVPHAERDKFERLARAEGFPSFRISQRERQGRMVPALKREEYFPVYFVEPYKGNEIALGFDLASNPARLEALEQARDTGGMVATSRITLVQETAGQHGFLVFTPIYRKGAPLESTAQRRRALIGFGLGVYRIGSMQEKALAYLEPKEIDLTIYDLSAPEGKRILHAPRPAASTTRAQRYEANERADLPTGLHYSKKIRFADRQWLAVCTPRPEFELAFITGWQPFAVSIFSLLLTGLLTFLLFYYLMRTAAQATAAAIEREKTAALSEAYRQLEAQALELKIANAQLEAKTVRLEQVSTYKSEFLANMSHELRTPLNSVMILAQMLAENEPGNLDQQQIEYAETIRTSGADLLSLINDILDLSKIEAGVMVVEIETIQLAWVATHIERTFQQVSDERGLEFAVHLEEGSVPRIRSDKKRLMQVLNNFLNNAFKFTKHGGVELTVSCPTEGWDQDHRILSRAERVVAFAVTDTGIGIHEQMRSHIFEAFQQAEAGTVRQFGGTGLGLSISREIARLLGGEITLSSQPGIGSTFTLYLPETHSALSVRRLSATNLPVVAMPVAQEEPVEVAEVPDDREAIYPGDRVLLVIEDDPEFARILLDLARTKGFKVVIVTHGDLAVSMVQQLKPDAITLDIQLQGMSGWVVLDRLKRAAETRHIPVLIISVADQSRRGLSMGALRYLTKPVDPERLEAIFDQALTCFQSDAGKILIVQDDALQARRICELLGNTDVEATIVGSGEEALEASRAGAFDCLILDPRLPDMSGFELLGRIAADPGLVDLRVILYTGKEFSEEEQARLSEFDQGIVVKGAASPEQLLSETSLVLHRIEADLPESKQRMIRQAAAEDPSLVGRTVLVVDDDVRNIFALTAMLRQARMRVLRARNGREALETLEQTPGVEIVLMDVMMPEMDGYEATRRIREMKTYGEIPIIALTARAMRVDREKCSAAGASDYLAKPVDTEHLLSLLRVWLHR